MSAPDLQASGSFACFYRAHLPAVYGYLFRLCAGDRDLAEDLTQDTWMTLARELRRGRQECADIRWLMTVARSRFLDHARRKRSAGRTLALVSSNDEYIDPPARHEVLAGLASLDPTHRLVLMLRYVDDRRHHDRTRRDHRAHAIVELAIRDLKEGSGWNHAPSGRFAANSAWLVIAALAHNLLRWTSLIGGFTHNTIVAKTVRRHWLALPGRLTRSARRTTLHLPTQWPRQRPFLAAHTRIRTVTLC